MKLNKLSSKACDAVSFPQTFNSRYINKNSLDRLENPHFNFNSSLYNFIFLLNREKHLNGCIAILFFS